MKLHLMSDIHLEFERGNTFSFEVTGGADVLILAGDIYLPMSHMTSQREIAMKFFVECSEKYPLVLMIPGNHDQWYGCLYDCVAKMREDVKDFPNIKVLDRNTEPVVIDGIAFWGDIFWTDIRKSNPETIWDVRRGMNDYNYIHLGENYDNGMYSSGKQHHIPCLPEDTINENFYAKQKLREFMTFAEENRLYPVVITHHAPSWRCVDRGFRVDELSYAYANTDIDDYLDELFPHFTWVHGHMHKPNGVIECGRGFIYNNPRGYIGHQAMAENYKAMEITIDKLMPL